MNGARVGGAKEQVRRLLLLLPYLLAHPGASVASVAKVFDVSERQLIADLGVLWFCGLPGLMPGDYIDVDMDAVKGEGVIHVSNAEFLTRPLRLSADEALGLLVALRVLREISEPREREIVDRVITRLEEASGQASAAVSQIAVAVDSWEDPETRALVREGLDQRRRLHLTYWVPARDETTERDVDPMRMVLADGRNYLEAWCRRAEDVRMFRLDRIADVCLLDAPAEPPPQAQPRDLTGGLFQASHDDVLVTFEVDPSAAWISEYYPCEEVDDLGEGRLRVRIRAADPRWVQRLALRLGPGARIVDPPELSGQVAAEAERALAAYPSVR